SDLRKMLPVSMLFSPGPGGPDCWTRCTDAASAGIGCSGQKKNPWSSLLGPLAAVEFDADGAQLACRQGVPGLQPALIQLQHVRVAARVLARAGARHQDQHVQEGGRQLAEDVAVAAGILRQILVGAAAPAGEVVGPDAEAGGTGGAQGARKQRGGAELLAA